MAAAGGSYFINAAYEQRKIIEYAHFGLTISFL